MRVLIAVLLAALPGLVAAQSRSVPDQPPSLPTIGLPLPSLGLPLPSPRSPRVERPVDRGDRRPPGRDPRGGDRRRGHSTQSFVYFVPAYGVDYQPGRTADAYDAREPNDTPRDVNQAPRSPEPARPSGTLWLDLQPAGGAQVYVDRFYVGTLDEIGAELTLDAGVHSVEVRALGYQTVDVDVKIEAGRAITYRGMLQPQAATAEAQPRAAEKPTPAGDKTVARKPFYAIPGCYLGDVPPKDAGLPATCDPSRAITIWP